MPQNYQDESLIEPSTASYEPEYSQEEDTSYAENNEALSDELSPSPATDTEEDAEALRLKLKMKARNERQLGSISASSTKFLVQSALKGDAEARQILSDPLTKKYVQDRYPSEYTQIFQEKKEVAEEAADIAYRKIEERTAEKQLRAEISRLGVRGEEDTDRILEVAIMNHKMSGSVENAARAAYLLIKGATPKAQPRLTSDPTPSLRQSETLDKSFINAFGPQMAQAYEKYKDKI